MSHVVGWDLGGAHLKAALVSEGRSRATWQVACPLWQGLRSLDHAIDKVKANLPIDCVHGVTMTGEMVDLFDDRSIGVQTLLERFSKKIGPQHCFVFQDGIFIPLSKFDSKKFKKIASNNWQISLSYLAQLEKNALLIDIGSTTCDILSVRNHHPVARGHDDFTRQRYDELIYMGVVRTPLMALSDQVPFQGERVPLMAEHFATIGDVYRILNLLPEKADHAETADGKPKTKAASMQRLARMIGLDRDDAPIEAWEELSRYLHEIQLQRLARACLYHLSRDPTNRPILVGAGVGRFLVEEMAKRLGLEYRDFNAYFKQELNLGAGLSAADCAPAAAIACLLESRLQT